MKIVEKRPLQLGIIILIILSLFSLVIYKFYELNRMDTFYDLLKERAVLRANILEEQKEKGYIFLKVQHLAEEQFALYTMAGEAYYKLSNELSQLDSATISDIRKRQLITQKNETFQSVFLYHTNRDKSQNIIYEAAEDRLGTRRIAYLKRILLFGTLLGSVFSYLVIRLIIRRGVDPLISIISKMQRIHTENLTDRLEEAQSNDEIGLMAKAFNGLMERLNMNITQQKSFTSYVSHELRNPLAILQGQTEIALLKQRTPKEYQRILVNMQEEISDLIMLVNDLLLLSKTSFKPEGLQFSPGRIDEVIWRAKDQLQSQKSQYNIEVTFTNTPENSEALLIPYLNEDLLKIAVYNLMENACKYSDDQRVVVKISVTTEFIEIHFQDSGKGIPEAELEDILRPYFRSSHTSLVEGHGLGLPLTKQIIDLHKANFKIESIIGKGTTVILQFLK